jgi:S-adenosylmethionine:tRNA ribosyltransferase-isomerase
MLDGKTLAPPSNGKPVLPDKLFLERSVRLDTPAFELPPELEASEPPEARGLARDEVRLMVSHYTDDRVMHTQFRNSVDWLDPGDVLVINTSGTLSAALQVARADGTCLELHLSTQLPADLWIVELRQPDARATQPFYRARESEMLYLPGGGLARLLAPYRAEQRFTAPNGAIQASGKRRVRLWIATLSLPAPLHDYLARYGFPIRYNYVKKSWPIAYYQTVYATEAGSAEMPSAGRAFTPELLTRLVARGIHVTPLLLHTGVASLEEGEPPYEEFYRVPLETARAVNEGRAAGKRVIAVGTTVVRALETAVDREGVAHPAEGWTRLVLTRERGLRVVDGLLTGLHEPRSSHLGMLEALAGRHHVQAAYAEALKNGYLWHEFGDLHLILP